MPALTGYGQTQIDPRAELLLGRAVRQEPIMGGMNLLGRLAALGVGQSRQRSFEDEIAASRLQYAGALQAAGTDPSARLAALGQGLASRDPAIRQAAAAQMAELAKTDTKIIGTPGGGSAAVTLQGGQIAGGPQQLVEGIAPAPEIKSLKQGESEVSYLWDADARKYVPIAEAPRQALDRGLTDEAAAQRMAISAAGASSVNVMNPTGPAAAVASVDLLVQQGLLDAETGSRIRAGLVESAAQTPEQAAAQATAGKVDQAEAVRASLQQRALALVDQAETFLQSAGGLAALSPSQRAAYDAIAEAAANAIAQAQGTPGAEPNAGAIERAKAALPGLGNKALGVDQAAAFSAIRSTLGQPPPAAPKAAKVPVGVDPALWQIMTPEERAAWD
jgi:hypothetical protein